MSLATPTTLDLPTRFIDSSLSPTSSVLKATAMYRKRQRDWRDADVPQEEQQDHQVETPRATRSRRQPLSHPLAFGDLTHSPQDHQRRPARGSSLWSSTSKPTDRHDSFRDISEDENGGEDDDQDTVANASSPFQEIQASVDIVGAQIAQAQRDVAQLRALLLRAVHTTKRDHRPAPPTANARVRIDHLCS